MSFSGVNNKGYYSVLQENSPKFTEEFYSGYYEDYYDLTPNKKLDGSRTDATTTMSKEGQLAAAKANTNISILQKNKEGMTSMSDPIPTSVSNTVDFNDTAVQNPYGYGYIPSLNEAQLQDAQNILNQENSIFAIGAVAGVSLIVLGIIITSTQNTSS